ncbi:MAG: DinB family protein [Armatimonadota bacterium]|nr:DinB family protein [Armatimonadota bacterium]
MTRQPEAATDDVVRQLLLDAFDLVHTHDGWIDDLPKSLRGVRTEQALWKPDAETPSIWEITLHVNQWMEDLIRDLRHEEAPKPEDWPAITEPTDEAWQATLDRTMDNLKTVRGLVVELKREDLLLPPKGRKTPTFSRLMSILVHDAYHAGQIVKMRQIMKAQGTR